MSRKKGVGIIGQIGLHLDRPGLRQITCLTAKSTPVKY